MTSPRPTPEPTPTTTTSSRAAEPTSPSRPQNGADAAMYDAIAVAQASIYGYGIVSAHSTPDLNYLVASSMAAHRKQREQALAMLQARSVDAPLPAAGYELPMEVDNPTDAANISVRRAEVSAVACPAVAEHAAVEEERAFAVSALTDCAVRAARWTRVLGTTPITVAFPGGSE